MSPAMDYKEALEYLYSIQRFGTKLGLANTTKLLEKLGNPHKELMVIHVGGTNGKGSVCAMISSILQEAGYKVGMYTSPHVKDFNERFLVNGKKISDKDVARLASIIKKNRDDQTFFEIVTAMAFKYFKEQKVDVLVLEVGLGGALDATNVIVPLVSVITNIGLEHTDYLGKNLASIAYEKSGIIKDNRPVITAAEGKALAVIKNVCKEKNSEMFLLRKPRKKYELSLKGDFQQLNAAIAVKTVDVLAKYFSISATASDIVSGLKKAYWPGRFEYFEENILVDCAHNLEGVKVLVHELKKIKKKKILVIGIMKDKNKEGMLRLLEKHFSKIILTKVGVPRASEPEELAKYLHNGYKIIKNPKEALKYAKSIAKNELIVVAGSIYLVGELYS
jgi:dihydrofolate synthase/folylpolyglutamate synthase